MGRGVPRNSQVCKLEVFVDPDECLSALFIISTHAYVTTHFHILVSHSFSNQQTTPGDKMSDSDSSYERISTDSWGHAPKEEAQAKVPATDPTIDFCDVPPKSKAQVDVKPVPGPSQARQTLEPREKPTESKAQSKKPPKRPEFAPVHGLIPSEEEYQKRLKLVEIYQQNMQRVEPRWRISSFQFIALVFVVPLNSKCQRVDMDHCRDLSMWLDALEHLTVSCAYSLCVSPLVIRNSSCSPSFSRTGLGPWPGEIKAPTSDNGRAGVLCINATMP